MQRFIQGFLKAMSTSNPFPSEKPVEPSVREELNALSPDLVEWLDQNQHPLEGQEDAFQAALRDRILASTTELAKRPRFLLPVWQRWAAAAILVAALGGAWFALQPFSEPTPCQDFTCMLEAMSVEELTEVAAQAALDDPSAMSGAQLAASSTDLHWSAMSGDWVGELDVDWADFSDEELSELFTDQLY